MTKRELHIEFASSDGTFSLIFPNASEQISQPDAQAIGTAYEALNDEVQYTGAFIRVTSDTSIVSASD